MAEPQSRCYDRESYWLPIEFFKTNSGKSLCNTVDLFQVVQQPLRFICLTKLKLGLVFVTKHFRLLEVESSRTTFVVWVCNIQSHCCFLNYKLKCRNLN